LHRAFRRGLPGELHGPQDFLWRRRGACVPVYSPNIDSIKVVRKGKVRRAKLYYLRDRRGKSARIAERVEPRNQG